MINLLQCVLPAIRAVVDNQGFEYCTYTGETTNALGVSVPSYSSWKKCEGSVQPMDARIAQALGLDFAERGILVWGSIDLNTLDQQDHPDKVRYRGRIYICRQCTDWHVQNGWNAFSCTEDKRERKSAANDENQTPEKQPLPQVEPTVPPKDGGRIKW